MSNEFKTTQMSTTKPQYVLVSNQYGYDLFIADLELGTAATDIESEAAKYSTEFDNVDIKLGYWRAVSGYDLQVRYVD